MGQCASDPKAEQADKEFYDKSEQYPSDFESEDEQIQDMGSITEEPGLYVKDVVKKEGCETFVINFANEQSKQKKRPQTTLGRIKVKPSEKVRVLEDKPRLRSAQTRPKKGIQIIVKKRP